MWAVVKFDKKKFSLIKSQMQQKYKGNFEVYCPKINFESFHKNKLIKKNYNLLGDYMFCFCDGLQRAKGINQIKYLNGVKILLDGFAASQKDIIEFIKKCKNMENNEGIISSNLFDIEKNKLYKFSTGPFTQKIFKIIEFQKNKIEIIMGNIKTSINKKDFVFNPLY